MKKLTLLAVALGSLLATGCPNIDDDAKIAAVEAVNARFKECYETLLVRNGTRSFSVDSTWAFTGMAMAMKELGQSIAESDRILGYIKAFAPAPSPLDDGEWRVAMRQDLPVLREIVVEHVGFAGNFVEFEPEGLNVVLTITIIDTASGSDVSMTMRFDELAPPKKGYPRRTYPPCTATEMGIEKIWQAFDAALARLPVSAGWQSPIRS